MTQDEIIEIVREVYGTAATEQEIRFAKLVAEKAFKDGYKKGVSGFMQAVELEREACALICDDQALGAYWEGADACAAAIRKRGQA